MSALNLEGVKKQPKKNEEFTLSFDDKKKAEEELNAYFGNVDDDVQFEAYESKVEPESPENVFLAQNPDVRKVIDQTSGVDVEYEGVNDKIADEVKKIVRKKIDASHVFLGLAGDVLAEAELAKNRIFTETNLTKISEDEIETAAEELFKKIEVAVAEIEMKHASTN